MGVINNHGVHAMPDSIRNLMAEMIVSLAMQTAQEIILATAERVFDPSQDSSLEAVIAMGNRKVEDSYEEYAIAMTGMSREDWAIAVGVAGQIASHEAGLKG